MDNKEVDIVVEEVINNDRKLIRINLVDFTSLIKFDYLCSRTVYNGDQFSQQLSYGGQGQGGFNQNSGYSQGNYSQGRQQNSFYDNRGSQSFGNNRGFGGDHYTQMA